METSSTWIPHFTGLLRTYWCHFADTESLSHRMVTGNSSTQPTWQPVVPHTPITVRPQPPLSSSQQDLLSVSPALVSPPQLDALVTVPDVHSNGGDYFLLVLIPFLNILNLTLIIQVFLFLNIELMKLRTLNILVNLLAIFQLSLTHHPLFVSLQLIHELGNLSLG